MAKASAHDPILLSDPRFATLSLSSVTPDTSKITVIAALGEETSSQPSRTRAPKVTPDTAEPRAEKVAPLPPAPTTLRDGPPLPPPGNGGDEDTPVLFSADSVFREDEDSPIIAEGNVRAFFGERFLRADRLVYDPNTNVVTASGNVSITDEKAETVFADRATLTGDLRDGVAENFSALLEQNARIAADGATREQGARTNFRKAVYTACRVCNEKDEEKIPTWRVKSLRVVRDEERKVIRFYHSFFELKGVPILYTPFIQGPDPAVERQSGILSPRVGASDRLGFNLEVPYYFAISNSQDATFFPKYTSRDGVLWQGEYRRRDDSGYQVLSGGFISSNNPENDEDAPPVRWHVFANGYRDIGEHLKIGYDVERVSDDLYLRRYDVRRRGDLRKELDTSQSNRLRSTGFVEFQKDGHKLRAENFVFQELRPRPDNLDSLTPYVLPLIDYKKTGWKVAGGDASIRANFAALQRPGGVDSRRLTASADWRREVTTRSGHRFAGFAQVRGDVYAYDDLDQGIEATDGAPVAEGLTGETSDITARFAPTIGAEWSYPLAKFAGNYSFFIEPKVQVAISPTGRNSTDIINEDSRSIEFDFASLFDFNKATGFDAFEDGQRLNIGISASAYSKQGFQFSTELGQQFRAQTTAAFSTRDATGALPVNFVNGVGGRQSDIVGSVNIAYRNVFGVSNRFRFSEGFGNLNRAESNAFLSLWRFRGNANYVRLNDSDEGIGLIQREELNAAAQFQLTDRWRTSFGWRQNLVTNEVVRQDIGLAYQDDCALFEVTYRRDRTRDRGLEQNNAILFRFTLKSLVD